jgi:hypothetical protein
MALSPPASFSRERRAPNYVEDFTTPSPGEAELESVSVNRDLPRVASFGAWWS